ncbi:hypothetical protein HZA76_03590 [Candidatus Roizmanbacteria bacterium]|nr:hypothetical protein [Candidatus Roizmanbacteria bacterium]
MTNNKSISNIKIKIFKLILFFLLFFWFSSIKNAYAADFRADYEVEYNLSQFKESLSSKVKFKIKITNLRGDVYVNKFAISFPRSFVISNIQSSDDHGTIVPGITSDDVNTKLEMEFSQPNVGRESINNFYLNFDQTNLFKANGNVWEVALPVIENRKGGSYKIVVTLPSDTDKKISISKPKPDLVSGNQVIWNNPQTKTIYAIFGDSQIYRTELTYHLKNSEIYPVSTEVAFPPDSLYQKIFIESINPEPSKVYQDIDGNYLGKYLLKPLESKTIIFRGLIEVFSEPREEMMSRMRKMLISQKDYLLSQQKFWQIKSLDKISNMSTAEGVYNFSANSLKYNYKKVNSNNSRLGAEGVLLRPDQAVCLEFTDLFIATAREKGIFAREIEGYGFSYDPQLQPLSLVSDVLHAWPEYYSKEGELWVPVDPTWENTSGIDYFSSFDLNHIVFAIHGKKSDYPLPAGMYKTGDSKDISIKATTEIPVDKKEVGIANFNLPLRISDNKKDYRGKFFVKNNGNVYLLEIPVEVKGENLEIGQKKIFIDSLAPYEEKEVDFTYRVSSANKKTGKSQGKISIFIYGNKLLERYTEIIPFVYLVLIIGAFSVFVVAAVFLTGKLILKKRKT